MPTQGHVWRCQQAAVRTAGHAPAPSPTTTPAPSPLSAPAPVSAPAVASAPPLQAGKSLPSPQPGSAPHTHRQGSSCSEVRSARVLRAASQHRYLAGLPLIPVLCGQRGVGVGVGKGVGVGGAGGGRDQGGPVLGDETEGVPPVRFGTILLTSDRISSLIIAFPSFRSPLALRFRVT